MKKMKLKKKKSLKVLIIPLIILLLYFIFVIFLKDLKLNSNEKFIKKILQDSNYHLVKEEQDINTFIKFTNSLNISLKEPISIIDKVFAYEKENNFQAFAYIQNNVVDNPRVYIYSTHPNEKYLGNKLENYELDNNVVLASILLQEKLNSYGIETLVEEKSVSKYLEDNSLKFNDSYKATRSFLKERLEKYDFDLIIDLHRDAISKNNSTIIEGKEYAKIMFVQNVNYKDNIALANKLNNILNKNYPTISRGIFNKYIDNFNQDLNKNVILIELGSNNNTIDEVINTIDALAKSIKELLK